MIIFCITFIHTWVAIFCSTSRIDPSQPHPGGRLTPSSCFCPCCKLGFVCSSPVVNMLFVPAVHISHTQPSPRLTTVAKSWHCHSSKHHGCATRYVNKYTHTIYNFSTYSSAWPPGRLSGPEPSCWEQYLYSETPPSPYSGDEMSAEKPTQGWSS